MSDEKVATQTLGILHTILNILRCSAVYTKSGKPSTGRTELQRDKVERFPTLSNPVHIYIIVSGSSNQIKRRVWSSMLLHYVNNKIHVQFYVYCTL